MRKRITFHRDAMFDDAEASPIYLDGERAYLVGRLADFPCVCRADGKGGDVEYSWQAVKRVLQGSRNFVS